MAGSRANTPHAFCGFGSIGRRLSSDIREKIAKLHAFGTSETSRQLYHARRFNVVLLVQAPKRNPGIGGAQHTLNLDGFLVAVVIAMPLTTGSAAPGPCSGTRWSTDY